MESSDNIIKHLEIKIKALEIENQSLFSHIETNNKEIKEFKSLIQSLKLNKSATLMASNEADRENLLIFKWKTSEVRRKLLCELKDDSKTVQKIAGGGVWNCTVIGDRCLIKGKINKWKIKINSISGSIVFGIVPSNIDLDGIKNWTKGYVTDFWNFGKHNLGLFTAIYNIQAKKEDIVEIIVDLEKGELSYSLNDIKLGIFCDNIILTNDYVPFVDIYNKGDEITLLE